MFSANHLRTARMLGVAMVATLGLASCATYDDEFATINSRLDQLDTRVQGAAQSAESANQSAQQANQRLDQLLGHETSVVVGENVLINVPGKPGIFYGVALPRKAYFVA